MQRTALAAACFLALIPSLMPARADTTEPTAYEQALYNKSRYQVISKLDDDAFVSYCVTMNVGGDTLLKFHDAILAKQTELTDLINQGLTNEDPRVMTINATLRDLRYQFGIKITEARKGLEIESEIANATLTALGQSGR